ncbi:MAG TPA: S1 family peptidase [Solirubrobacteraceae bacterium]|nr:S1 family peptidase [Solirubrobacteraceae bacterium]
MRSVGVTLLAFGVCLGAAAPSASAERAAANPALSEPLTREGNAQEAALAERLNLSASQATQDIQVQKAVGNLNASLEEALGDTFAEVWFDPYHGRFDVGVAPSTQPAESKAQAIIDAHGLASVTDYVPVRSTKGELEAALHDWTARNRGLLHKQQAETMIDAAANAVRVKISDAADSAERSALRQAAATSDVKVEIETVPAALLSSLKAAALGECVFKLASPEEDFCNPPLVGGVGIFSEGWIEGGEAFYALCTAGFMAQSKLPESYPDHYLLTAGHCFEDNETTENGKWYSADDEETGTTMGKMAYHYINSEGDAAFIDMNAHTTYWKTGNPIEWWPYIYTPEQSWGPEFAPEDYPINRVGTNDPPNVQYQVACHVGWSSGVHCGLTEATNVTASVAYHSGTKEIGNLVENSACATPGDSGGPWIFNGYAMGLMVATSGTCPTGTASLFDDQHTLDKNLGMKIVGWGATEE